MKTAMKKIFLSLIIAFAAITFCSGQNNFILRYNRSAGTGISSDSVNKINALTEIKKLVREIDSSTKKDLADYSGRMDFFIKKAYPSYSKDKNSEEGITDADKKKVLDSLSHIFIVPQKSSERNVLLKTLKDSLINRDDIRIRDTTTMKRISDEIKEIKDYNSWECITSLRRPRTFFIFNAGKYDIDTLNDFFYQQNIIDVFQAAAIQNFTNSNTLVSAELASFLFGPLRLGVGGSFATKQDTSKDNAIKTSLQKVLSNNGDANFNFSLPLLFMHTRKKQIYFSVFAQSNNSINPGIDSTGKTDFSKDVLFTNQSGLDFHFDFGSNDNQARISIDFPYYYIWGSKATYQQLNQTDFSVLKVQIGAVLGNLVNLHVSGPLYSSSKNIQRIPFAVSLQFSPTQVVKAAEKK